MLLFNHKHSPYQSSNIVVVLPLPAMNRIIVIIAHDLRSTHNVGSLLRTAEGLGVQHVYLTGYTPYPLEQNDTRLPHLAQKIHKAIQKTALGAEISQAWSHHTDVNELLKRLKHDEFTLVALEQSSDSVQLPDWSPPEKVALLLGREVEGIEPGLLKQMDKIVEIPMSGKKESFNVVQAAAMAMYHLRFTN